MNEYSLNLLSDFKLMTLLLSLFCRPDTELEEDDLTESDGELQLITECWVEPQMGHVVNSTLERRHLDGLDYSQLAKGVC